MKDIARPEPLQATTLLIDLDGTVFFKGRLIPGAADAIAAIRRAGLRLQFLTNIDSRTGAEICDRIAGMGLAIGPHEITTCLDAALAHVTDRPGRCYCLLPSGVAGAFDACGSPDGPVRYVVVGDQRQLTGYAPLNTAFGHIMAGAEIVALQKGRFYHTAEGLNLDTGAFVAALEYASGKPAVVVGKPAPAFFHAALRRAGGDAAGAIVVGDDVTTDIAGAAACGLRSILVRTGKGGAPRPPEVPSPTRTIDSIADLPAIIRAAT